MKTLTENIVSAYIDRKGLNKSELARKMGMSNQNLGARLNKATLQYDFLMELSVALEHDFFADLSLEYRKATMKVENVVNEPVAEYGPDFNLKKEVQKLVAEELKKHLK